jgi:hypothetical protein
LAFLLLSAGRGREQCGDRRRGQESASLHCCSNAAAERGFLTEKVPANVRPNGLPVIRQFLRFPYQRVLGCARDYSSSPERPRAWNSWSHS